MAKKFKLSDERPRLEAVLARLSENIGPMLATKAVKLPYLVDVVATTELGRPITDARHETWEHGVVAREAWIFLKHGPGSSAALEVEPHSYSESGVQVSRATGRPAYDLTDEERLIVDYVAEHFGHLNAADLGQLTKTMNPERRASDWGENYVASLGEDACARLSAQYRALERLLDSGDAEPSDRSRWSEPIRDPRRHLRAAFGA